MDNKNGSCLACKGKLQKLMTFENMPAGAQYLLKEEELESDHGISLELCQCMSCGLVQFDTTPVDYYKDVIRAGGGTRTMRKLRRNGYTKLLTAMQDAGIRGRKILEVGCGKGEFLEMWDDLPEEVLTREAEKDRLTGERRFRPLHLFGLEHDSKLITAAQEKLKGKNVTLIEGFAEHGGQINGAPFDAFVQFNFLEHQPDPGDMLDTIWSNLAMGGMGLLTVPSFEYILQNDGYYELLRDHIANYTIFTLMKLLQDHGFEVLDSEIINRDTIEVLVRKTDPDTLTSLGYCGQITDVSALKKNYQQMKMSLQGHLDSLKQKGLSLAVWGAGHQGFTLASTTELGGKVRYIIDSADFKQGKYAPGSHLPIVSPEHFFKEPVDEILIAAPGYTDEIAEIIRSRFGNHTEIYVLRSEKIEKLTD